MILLAACGPAPTPIPPAPTPPEPVVIERGCPGEPIVVGGPPDPLPSGVTVTPRSSTGARVDAPRGTVPRDLVAAAARQAGLRDPRQALHELSSEPRYAAVECVDGIRVLGAAVAVSVGPEAVSAEVVIYPVPPLPPLGPPPCARPSLAIDRAHVAPTAVYACPHGAGWAVTDAASGEFLDDRATPLFPR